ncbi:hypothetical protein BST12_14275 [Mycobacterium angelicum]|uniref:Uncharacterized protein n=2 Tax=Mycobacterium angelicum TaxID=470074 RepID=A0A1W9ZSJ8_MYCAN|nr:hypothetical protein BST12_14275 [Mycobacterium angelicum]
MLFDFSERSHGQQRPLVVSLCGELAHSIEAMSDPSRPAIEALTDAIRAAVRKALDTPEFHDAVDAAAKRFLSEVGQQAQIDARADDVALQIKSAVMAPVWREVLAADELPEGLIDPLLAVQQVVGDIGSQINVAIRDAIRRATD